MWQLMLRGQEAAFAWAAVGWGGELTAMGAAQPRRFIATQHPCVAGQRGEEVTFRTKVAGSALRAVLGAACGAQLCSL